MKKIDYYLKNKEKNEIMRQKLINIYTSINSYIKKKKSKIEIADLGCANGIVSLPLLYWGYKVTCVEMNSTSLNKLKNVIKNDSNIMERCTLINKSIEEYKTNKKFDVVILTEVIEHVANPDTIISKLYSLLKPDGILILSMPNGFGSYELFFDWPLIAWRKIFHIKTIPGHYHVNFFTLGKIRSLLNTSGFKQIKFIKSSFFPIIPFSSTFLERIDNKIAAIMPAQLVNGWMLISRK